MITYNSNIRSMRAIAALERATGSLRTATERLSSGQRINRASDDAAGLSVSSILRANSRVYSTGIRNLSDGLSAINIADSGLTELTNITLRIKELAQQAANGTFSLTQRTALNTEASQLTDEFNRILQTVKFNGRGLLNLSERSLRLQAGFGLEGSLRIGLGDELARTVGNGTYSARSAIAVNNNPVGTTTADVDGDGDNDILFGLNSGGGMGVLLNNGNGTFAAQTTVAGGVAGDFIAADVNGDGNIDGVSAHSITGELTVYSGNGNGTFDAGVNLGVNLGGSRLEAGDFNNDGIIDLVGGGAATFSIALGNGDGTFTLGDNYSGIVSGIRQIVVVDFDHDGNQDIAVANNSATVTILKGGGSGAFSLHKSIAVSANAQGLSVADFNGDGRQDLGVGYNLGGASGQVQTYLQQSDGNFSLSETFGASVNAQQMTTTDLNGDGIPDLISTNTTNASLFVLIGRGDGTFASSTLTAGGTTNHSAVGDMNGDGAVDIIVRDSATTLGFFAANSTETSSLQRLSLYDRADALQVLNIMDETLARVIQERGALGTAASRVEAALNVLRSTTENFEAAAGRITDTDVAVEAAEAARSQILQNVAASVLSQANQQPTIALRLLSGISPRRR